MGKEAIDVQQTVTNQVICWTNIFLKGLAPMYSHAVSGKLKTKILIVSLSLRSV